MRLARSNRYASRLQLTGKDVWTFVLVALMAALIMMVRPRAVERYENVSTLEEVYALPDPEQLKVLSLGYRSALADLLFGQTLVAAGRYFGAKKVFENVDGYLKAIVALEPRYRGVYYYADVLLTLSSVEMPKRNFRIARELKEKGLKLFPDDADLWISAGQFMTYLAVQWLPKDEDPDEWKQAGVRMIEHACAIWPYEKLPNSCIGSTSVLKRLGETEATIRSLERLIAITDDPATKKDALARLEKLVGEKARDELRSRLFLLASLKERDLPQLSRTAYQLVGPKVPVGECVGLHAPVPPSCATSFAELRPELRKDSN